MTAVPSPWRVPSGVRFGVQRVGEHEPLAIEDFVGDRSFTVSAGEEAYQITGTGRLDGDSVHFFEKTLTGKDLRVWQVRGTDAGFVAEHLPSF